MPLRSDVRPGRYMPSRILTDVVCPPTGPEADAWVMEHVFGWEWKEMPQHNALVALPESGPNIWCLVRPGSKECSLGARVERGIVDDGFYRCSQLLDDTRLMEIRLQEMGLHPEWARQLVLVVAEGTKCLHLSGQPLWWRLAHASAPQRVRAAWAIWKAKE